MKDKTLTRRDFLRMGAVTAAGAALAGCAPKVVKETVVVEKPVEKVVKETVVVAGTAEVVEKVVTATPAPKEPVTIHFTSYAPWEIYDPLIQEIIDERGLNINFTGEQTVMVGGHAGYADTLITRLAGGEQIDCLHVAVHGMFTLVAKNILAPLDGWLDGDPAFKQDVDEDIHPSLIELVKWQGKQWMLPGDWNNMSIYYNTKIYEEKGVPKPTFDWTWDDFLEVSKAVSDVQGTEDDVYAFAWYNWTFGWDPWFYNNDTSVLTDDWMDSNMLDPKMAETLQYMADMINVHKVAANPATFGSYVQFPAGYCVMAQFGGWGIPACHNAGFEDFNFTYHPTNRGGPIRTCVGTAGPCLTRATRYPEEAWEVVKAVSSTESQLSYMSVDGSLQSRRSVVETDYYQNFALPSKADMGHFYASLDYAKPSVTPPNYNIIEPMLTRWFSQLWSDEISVEECVQGAHEELQAEMDIMKAALNL